MAGMITCITPETGLHVLDIRWSNQKPVPVNLYGQLMAVSEITKVKDSSLFLAKFLPGVDIIVKKKELLHWQSCLVPQKEYVITGLRPTTLQKGSQKPTRVYTVTEASRLLSPDTVTVNLVPLQKWLTLHKLEGITTDSGPEARIVDRLFSYKGVITCVLDRMLGVYELDKKVRLFSGQVPAKAKTGSLQVGETITIHNAHHRLGNQVQRLTIYSCMLTNMTVEKQTTMETPKERPMSQLLQQYLYLYGMSTEKLNFLFCLRQTLKQQFFQLFCNKGVEKILTSVLSIPVLSWKQSTEGPYRNLVDEFISSPHVCNLTTEITEETLPEYVTVNELLHTVESLQQEQTDQWHCVRHNNDRQVLLGLLTTCEKTGQSIIYDSTGRIPIVTSCCHNNDTECDFSTMKNCHEHGSCLDLQRGNGFPCQNFHVFCRDKLVAFKRFVMVIERMSDNALYKTCITNNKKFVKYICVNLKEAVILGSKAMYVNKPNFVGQTTGVVTSETDMKNKHQGGNMDGKENNDCQLDRMTRATDILCTESDSVDADNKNSGSLCSTCVKDIAAQQSSAAISVKPVLHKHIQEDGSVRFCRNTMCVKEETNTVNVCNNSKSIQWGSTNSAVCKDNDRKAETLDKHVKDEKEDMPYSVKPLVKRKSVGNCLVSEINHSKFKKLEKGDSGIFVFESKVCEGNFDKTDHKKSESMMVQTEVGSYLYSDKHKKKADILNKSIKNEMEDISFSVKPVVKRKIVGNCLVTEISQSKLKKSGKNDIENCGCESEVWANNCDKTDHRKTKSTIVLAEVGSSLCSDLLNVSSKPEVEQDLDAKPFCSVDVYVESKEALRYNGLNAETEHHMACMECIQLTEKNNKMIVMLQGSVLKWYPCLQTGHMYRLTTPAGDLPLLASKMPQGKIQKAIKRCNTKTWWTLHEETVVEELYHSERDVVAVSSGSTSTSIATVLSLASDVGDFVEIVGLVTKRVVVGRDQQQREAHSSHHRTNNPGSDSLNTRVDLQELGGRQVIQIYLDHRSFILPLGLIPGAIVRFKKLERKVSRSGNVYCRFVPLSSVEIKCVSDSNIVQSQYTKSCDKQTDSPPSMTYLVDLLKQQERNALYLCICDVSQISKLSLKCACEYCGSTVVKSRCSNAGCFGGEAKEMVARASVIVDDGTCVAMVTMSGSCVQSLLQLSLDQWTALEKETSQIGELFVQQTKQLWDSPMEQFIYMLCDNRLVKRTWLMTLRYKNMGKGSLDLDQIRMDEFAQKTFDTGLTKITTHCLPFLQLECVAMEAFDPAVCSTLYLTKT